ncbi:Recombinase zinc beta ribbon domain-containing protein [Eubacterium pyruvativorans]|uniref:Recombinase zinc beta ribbon domain-containing protein n=1 Tax=Eubacterium pyruvativorans TaxID=155865 RepID=A0A1I7IKI5_9FIRM|nr:recombinase family protein [Eubacterium pyruvativorans]SFO42487.1 Recombinase zinc beta ribbon domain-containing protein [Eubacterium pyruvativorans]SFU73408.1 Recombinase zinc beta ribbon domain-containing protein [Eubacterium pyruvativorans]
MSQNIRLGIQYRFQQGKMQVNFSRFLGYTRDEEGMCVIVPEEAKTVKRIFREYLEGASLVEICRGLEADGILTGAHKEKWRPETVQKMLRNEKYMGGALLQKTYTTDFITKKKVVNNGIAPQYYVENSHEAIIPKNLFMRVQEEMERRSNLTSGAGRKKRLYSSKYALSGIVFCGHCGEIFRRIRWNNRGCRSTVWRCVSRVLKKSSEVDCPARTLHEETLHEAVVAAINQVLALDETFFENYRKSLDAALGANSELSLREIEELLTEKQRVLVSLSPEDPRYEMVADEIYGLRDRKQQVLMDDANRETAVRRAEELMEFVRAQEDEIEKYDDSLVRKLIEKVTVYDDRINIAFKSGVDVDIEA